MGSRTLDFAARIGYFAYVAVLLLVIYVTVETLLQANYGATLAKDANATLERYKVLYDFANLIYSGEDQSHAAEPPAANLSNTTYKASSNPAADVLQDLRVSVLVKNCAIVSWTTSLPFFLRSVGSVVDNMKQHSSLCANKDIFRLASGSATKCTASEKNKSNCIDVDDPKIVEFMTIAPSGNVLPFAENVGGRTSALLQQLHTVLLPFLFGVVGGFLAVFFNPTPEVVHIVAPGGEATRYMIRPFVGGVAGLLVCFLFVGSNKIEPSYSINTLGLLVGYGLELLPLSLNAGVLAIREMLKKDGPKSKPPRANQGI